MDILPFYIAWDELDFIVDNCYKVNQSNQVILLLYGSI